ncbi:MAG: HesA/MoeB/ThiF family protein [Nanoarchaeota archaeon]
MRYLRLERFLGRNAQREIQKAKVAVVGLGALGSAAVSLLIRMGIKRFLLVDRDVVEESNLGSQQIYQEKDIGMPKIEAVENFLKEINNDIEIEAYFEHLDFENISKIKADIVLDCTDNLDIRFLLNEYCVKNKIPLVYSAAIKDKGCVFVVNNGPCLKCILKDAETSETCETVGIINTIANLIASIQVNEAIKVIIGKDYEKNLLYVSLDDNKIEKIKVGKEKNCNVCNWNFEYLDGKKDVKLTRYCSSGAYLIKKKFDFEDAKKRLKKLGGKEFKNAVLFDKITLFKNAAFIKAKDEKEALSIYSKYIGN